VATLNDLVGVLAEATGIPSSTVFAFGRFAREGGFISQRGRGRSAAEMTVYDAANLLIAIGGTSVTRDAAETIDFYNRLQATAVITPIVNGDPEEVRKEAYQCLRPLMVLRVGQKYRLGANLGYTLAFLIERAGSGELQRLLHTEPGSRNVTSVRIEFNRTAQSAQVWVWGSRWWFEATFSQDRTDGNPLSGFEVTATIGLKPLARLGAALQGNLLGLGSRP
jgi:catechol 2,3-dioxygenase-like lactoylglutathione lyase family enzyme